MIGAQIKWYDATWYWWWLAFLLLFFLLPVGYGWFYRGWGPWYRRSEPLAPADRASRDGGSTDLDEQGWGWLGAIIWGALILALLWLVAVWIAQALYLP